MKLVKTTPDKRPICEICNKNVGGTSGHPNADGTRYYKRECTGCINIRVHGRRNATKKQWHKPGMGYRRHKKDHCEKCQFVAVHACQLDVDHIDGDRQNNAVENLQTLCANCHRLKTRESKQDHNKLWRAA